MKNSLTSLQEALIRGADANIRSKGPIQIEGVHYDSRESLRVTLSTLVGANLARQMLSMAHVVYNSLSSEDALVVTSGLASLRENE